MQEGRAVRARPLLLRRRSWTRLGRRRVCVAVTRLFGLPAAAAASQRPSRHPSRRQTVGWPGETSALHGAIDTTSVTESAAAPRTARGTMWAQCHHVSRSYITENRQTYSRRPACMRTPKHKTKLGIRHEAQYPYQIHHRISYRDTRPECGSR